MKIDKIREAVVMVRIGDSTHKKITAHKFADETITDVINRMIEERQELLDKYLKFKDLYMEEKKRKEEVIGYSRLLPSFYSL